MFQVCHANGCGFTADLGTLRFHKSDYLHVSIRGTCFSLLFPKAMSILPPRWQQQKAW